MGIPHSVDSMGSLTPSFAEHAMRNLLPPTTLTPPPGVGGRNQKPREEEHGDLEHLPHSSEWSGGQAEVSRPHVIRL